MARDSTPDMSGFGYIDSPRGGQAGCGCQERCGACGNVSFCRPWVCCERGRGRFLVKEGIGYPFRYRSYQYCKFHSEEPYVPRNGRGQRTFR